MKIVSSLAGLVLGGLVGLAAALGAAGIVGPGLKLSGSVEADGWSSDWTIGAPAANPWTRARVARHGLLALTKEEAVYFTRNTDEAGDRLDEACLYRVSGGTLPAQWWSITLYDAASYLPRNTDNALSFDLTDAVAGGQMDAWSFVVSGSRSEGAWVSSRAGGAFDLTLRLYKPTPELIGDPGGVLVAPRIEKLSCGETA